MKVAAAKHHAQVAADTELWAQFTKAPIDGLASIYDRYAGIVYGLARRVLGNRQDSEDLVQEVFLSLLNHCTYDPARGSLAAYLIAMTRSRAIDRVRARGRSLRLLNTWASLDADTPARPLPSDQASLQECASAMLSALEQLPKAQREVIELAYFKGLTQTEIAEHLSAPLGSVKSWARKGVLSLRAAMQTFVD